MRKNKEFEFLAENRLFRGCKKETVNEIISSPLYEKREYKKGEKIAYETGAIAILYVGKIKVGGRRDHRKLFLNRMAQGATFGFSSLFENESHFETDIVAVTAAVVGFIPEELIGRAIEKDSIFAMNIISVQSEKIRFLNSKILSYTAPTTKDKLLLYLNELPCDEHEVRKLPHDMTALAARLNMGRASLYRAFSALEKEGIIEKSGNEFKIITK